MAEKKSDPNELDLHYTEEDPDFGIAQEGISFKNLDEISKRISAVKSTVRKINLDNQEALTEIPAVLKECQNLEELNISHTNIKKIPGFLFTLPKLCSLSCCCNKLQEFPEGIAKAVKLEFLHLRINNGWKKSEKITSLTELKTLVLDLYSDAALPENLGALTKLEDFSLMVKFDESAVPSLPESLKNHPALKKLNISDPFYKNRKTFDLDHASKILSSCAGFESLKLSGIAVGTGHKTLSMISGLKELELRHLPIEEGDVFEAIANLNKLEKLYILGSNLKITEIPDIFMNLKNLKVFCFAGNMITDLPPSIYSLENLTTLEVGSTGISKLDGKIAEMRNLESIQVYDNILETLPEKILTLPKLKVLNIEENAFTPNYIVAIKQRLKALEKNGQKIEFMYDRQGYRQMVKKFRAIKNIKEMDISLYVKYCANAINENYNSIKYVSIEKLQGTPHYLNLCITSVRKSCFSLELIDSSALGKSGYFSVCFEAAKSPGIGNAFKLIKEDLMTKDEYLLVCLEAALHNKCTDFLSNFTDEYIKVYGREIYERLCWVAVMRHPPVISKMLNPTKEIRNIALKRGFNTE